MAPKVQKSKEAKAKAAAAGGQKSKKKKWSKGRAREVSGGMTSERLYISTRICMYRLDKYAL